MKPQTWSLLSGRIKTKLWGKVWDRLDWGCDPSHEFGDIFEILKSLHVHLWWMAVLFATLILALVPLQITYWPKVDKLCMNDATGLCLAYNLWQKKSELLKTKCRKYQSATKWNLRQWREILISLTRILYKYRLCQTNFRKPKMYRYKML